LSNSDNKNWKNNNAVSKETSNKYKLHSK